MHVKQARQGMRQAGRRAGRVGGRRASKALAAAPVLPAAGARHRAPPALQPMLPRLSQLRFAARAIHTCTFPPA